MCTINSYAYIQIYMHMLPCRYVHTRATSVIIRKEKNRWHTLESWKFTVSVCAIILFEEDGGYRDFLKNYRMYTAYVSAYASI